MSTLPFYGGNAHGQRGSLTLNGSAQQIPTPSGSNTPKLESAVIRFSIPAHAVYLGEDNTVTTSGATIGFLMPASTVQVITSPRTQLWVIGTNADVLTWWYEYN